MLWWPEKSLPCKLNIFKIFSDQASVVSKIVLLKPGLKCLSGLVLDISVRSVVAWNKTGSFFSDNICF